MIPEKLRDKRVYISDGVPKGKIILLAECGRVMAIVDIADPPDDLIMLTDTVCIHYEDARNDEAASPSTPEEPRPAR